MKSFFSHFTGATAALSLLVTVQAALSNSSAPSCGAPKVDDSYFSVVGVQGTGIHPRQEIRDLEKDTETWNLYIQALARFQAMNEKDKTSYYQVSGKRRSHHQNRLI
jgi:tyrosinase